MADPHRRASPVAAAAAGLAIYLGLLGILLWLSLARTAGEFTYAQDDPYIHLAMARTLAEHGVWGVRAGEFASASSSPLWTLLLAGLWALGAHQVWVPFALNVVFGMAVVVLAARYAAELSPRAPLVVAAIVLVTPLPTLAFIGMEHTLQVLLVLVFAWQACERLAGDRDDWLRPSMTAAVMAATRYESLFLVAVVGAVLLWRGRVRPAAILAAASAAPLAVFAAYSVAHGGLILPNSVLMKSGPGRFESFSAGVAAVAADWIAVRNLFLRPPQLALTLAALGGLLLVPAAALRGARVWLVALFVATSVLHACLVKLEWFFRYEAYLMVLGVLALAGLAAAVEWPRGVERKRRAPWHPATIPLLVLLGMPLAVRALTALATTSGATGNIFEQQVQLGRFFRQHYPGRPIAVNDLGAVAWLSTSPILDIVGLASQPVADLKRRRSLDAAALGRLADERHVEAIALYEDVFAPILPASWVKVGEWKIQNNVGVSGDVVAFFARTDLDAAVLERALQAYAASLPEGVGWRATRQRVLPVSAGS